VRRGGAGEGACFGQLRSKGEIDAADGEGDAAASRLVGDL